MYEFKLPDLGEGIHEGEIIKWYTQEGQTIEQDEPLVEVETDKAAVTIPSPVAGTIIKLHGNPGDTVYTDHVIAEIETTATQSTQIATAAIHEEASLPMKEVQISDKKETITQNLLVGNAPPLTNKVTGNRPVPAAPATRRVARELGIDINLVPGSGPAGRVTTHDVKAFNNQSSPSASQKQSEKATQPSTSNIIHLPTKPVDNAVSSSFSAIPLFNPEEPSDFDGEIEIQPFMSIRRKTAKKMVSAALLIPHAAHLDEIDITDLEQIRKSIKANSTDDIKLTFMSFVIKATSRLLQKYPQFNASLRHHSEELILKKYYNIGFAADTPKGLMVPVIKQVDHKSIMDIAFSIQELADQARQGDIAPDDLKGGTFTITNIGALGGSGMTPIINHPEVAILALGKATEKPVVKDGEIVIRTIMPVNLTFDHRVLDGADAARFINDLKNMLSNSHTLLTSL